jgi:hypothetical protein
VILSVAWRFIANLSVISLLGVAASLGLSATHIEGKGSSENPRERPSRLREGYRQTKAGVSKVPPYSPYAPKVGAEVQHVAKRDVLSLKEKKRPGHLRVGREKGLEWRQASAIPYNPGGRDANRNEVLRFPKPMRRGKLQNA